jgi:hypothetical protein
MARWTRAGLVTNWLTVISCPLTTGGAGGYGEPGKGPGIG